MLTKIYNGDLYNKKQISINNKENLAKLAGFPLDASIPNLNGINNNNNM